MFSEQTSNAPASRSGQEEPVSLPNYRALPPCPWPAAAGTSLPVGNRLVVKSSLSKAESSVELPGVSERRPIAFPIDTAPSTGDAVFIYSPMRGEWTIALHDAGTWFDRATGEEIQRPTHWMPLPEPVP
jgi:hypothetical protein